MQPTDMELWKAKDVARLLSLVEADRRYFQELVAAIPTAFAVVAADLNISYGNSAFRHLLGGRTSDVAGPLEQVLPGEEIQAAVRQVLADSKPATATTMRDGQQFDVRLHRIRHWEEDEVLLTLTPAPEAQPETTPSPLAMAMWTVDATTMRFSSVECGDLPFASEEWREGADFLGRQIVPSHLPGVREFYQDLVAGKPLASCDYQAQTLSGGVAWLRDVVHLETGADGKAASIRGMSLDITEARGVDAQRYQAHRVEALSRLANRAVHDCNNLLMIMGGYGEDLLHALPPESSLRLNVQEILTAGERLATFTRRLGLFTKRHPARISTFGLDAFLLGLRPDLEALLPAGVKLDIGANTGDTLVSTDPQHLASAIHTLVQRAVAGLQNGGLITILGGRANVRHLSEATPVGLAPGSYAKVEVHDSGLAVHPDTMARLFEPDASTDPVRQKLPAVYQDLRAIGCDLEVSGAPNQGTKFQILLPLGATEKKASVLPPAFLEALAKPQAKPEPREPQRPAIKSKPVEPEPGESIPVPAPPPSPPPPKRSPNPWCWLWTTKPAYAHC